MESPHQAAQELIAQLKDAAGQPVKFQRLSDQLSVLTKAHMEIQFDAFPSLQMGTPMRRLANALMLRLNQTATKDALMNAMYFDKTREPGIKIVDVLVCKLRKKLHNTEYRIETCWGSGYRMVRSKIETVR